MNARIGQAGFKGVIIVKVQSLMVFLSFVYFYSIATGYNLSKWSTKLGLEKSELKRKVDNKINVLIISSSNIKAINDKSVGKLIRKRKKGQTVTDKGRITTFKVKEKGKGSWKSRFGRRRRFINACKVGFSL